MTRTFGIEIEVSRITKETSRNALRLAGFDANIEHLNHHTRTYWKVTDDSSVYRGHEIVSPVLYGEGGLFAAEIAIKALKDAGATAPRSCGFHVHVGVEDLSFKQISNIATRYKKFENIIDRWMPAHRNNNRFCRSLRNTTTELNSVDDLHSYRFDRYSKINLKVYTRQKTVEFRHHNGTVDAKHALAWIRFCLGFTEQSKILDYTGDCGDNNQFNSSPVNYLTEYRAGSAIRMILVMIERGGGAHIDDLVTVTGWQRHTIRGAISQQLRQRGVPVVGTREGRGTRYRLQRQDPPPPQSATEDHVFAGIDQDVRQHFEARAQMMQARTSRVRTRTEQPHNTPVVTGVWPSTMTLI